MNHVSICQRFYQWNGKKKSKNIAGKILESTVIGSAAKNENWTVN